MKRGNIKMIAAALMCAVMLALKGCSTWTDEDGRHFMLFGERGPSGVVSQEDVDDADDMNENMAQSTAPQDKFKAGDDYPDYDDSDALTAGEDDGAVSALSYQRGMMSDSPVLLELL